MAGRGPSIPRAWRVLPSGRGVYRRSSMEQTIQMQWRYEPGKCHGCQRELKTPGPVAVGDGELYCPDCVWRALEPERYDEPSFHHGIPEPRALIAFVPEKIWCGRCKRRMTYTPGFVAIARDGKLVCTICVDVQDLTVAWLLKAAQHLRDAIGYWPGSPVVERRPSPEWVEERRQAAELIKRRRERIQRGDPEWWKDEPAAREASDDAR